MGNINVGARPAVQTPGEPKVIKTKKALRELLSQDPASVVFYGTSPFTPFNGTVKELAEGDMLTVCGPDPYTARNWWANIKRQGNAILIDDKKIKQGV